MKKKLPFTRGFTLLELLVVISIIGILIAMTSVAFATAQQKSRDARRRADVKSLQEGFEQYYAIFTTYGTYAAMTAEPELFPAGGPNDPKTGISYSATFSQTTTDDYCQCALLESATGNSNADCSGLGTSTGTHYCLVNLQ